jgi:hypothetical protein
VSQVAWTPDRASWRALRAHRGCWSPRRSKDRPTTFDPVTARLLVIASTTLTGPHHSSRVFGACFRSQWQDGPTVAAHPNRPSLLPKIATSQGVRHASGQTSLLSGCLLGGKESRPMS